MNSKWWDALPTGVLLRVRVVPRAGRSGVAGTRDGALLVRLNSAPVDGKANRELIEVIAEALDVSKRMVSIAVGEKSRLKVLLVTGVTVDEVRAKLE